jgi:hypothetical protein
MPEVVREVFDPLKRGAITTHHHWQLMLQLYDGEERVNLLRRFGCILFGRIQKMMLSDVMLGICRLTDPPEVRSNRRKQSLGIPRLIAAVEADCPGLPDQLKLPEMMKELEVLSAPIRDMRNRFLAHRDWATRDQPCPVRHKEEIDKCLKLTAAIMRAVYGHYTNAIDSYTMYPSTGDGDDFMRHLRDYARYLDEIPKPQQAAGQPGG